MELSFLDNFVLIDQQLLPAQTINSVSDVLKGLLEASPYAVLLVLAFVLFYFMHKKAMDALKDNTEKTIAEIRKAYSDVIRNYK